MNGLGRAQPNKLKGNEMTSVGRVGDGKHGMYIGRPGKGESGYFGNPFHLNSETQRGDTINKFATYCEERIMSDDNYATAVKSLYGKHLQCFCAPHVCHGWVLAMWAARLNQDEVEAQQWEARIIQAIG